MTNNEMVFNKIFGEVGAKHNLTKWWEIFDSEVFEEVKQEIAKYFNVSVSELYTSVEGYAEWHYEMCMDL
jgi:hypothetical protein